MERVSADVHVHVCVCVFLCVSAQAQTHAQAQATLSPSCVWIRTLFIAAKTKGSPGFQFGMCSSALDD